MQDDSDQEEAVMDLDGAGGGSSDDDDDSDENDSDASDLPEVRFLVLNITWSFPRSKWDDHVRKYPFSTRQCGRSMTCPHLCGVCFSLRSSTQTVRISINTNEKRAPLAVCC